MKKRITIVLAKAKQYIYLSARNIMAFRSLVIIPLILLLAMPVASAWTDWNYWKVVTISNPTGTQLNGYITSLTIETQNDISTGKMKSDCSDLRFAQGSQEFEYWIESGCNTNQTLVWIKLPTLPAAGMTLIMHFGNPIATPVSNPGIFPLYDNFDGQFDQSKWSIFSTSGPSAGSFAQAGYLALDLSGICQDNGTTMYGVLSTTNGGPWSIKAKARVMTQDGKFMLGSWSSLSGCGEGMPCSYMSSSNGSSWLGSILNDSSVSAAFTSSASWFDGTWQVIETGILPSYMQVSMNGIQVGNGHGTFYAAPTMPGMVLSVSCLVNESPASNADIDWIFARPYVRPEPVARIDSTQPICGNALCQDWETPENCQIDCSYIQVPVNLPRRLSGGAVYWEANPIFTAVASKTLPKTNMYATIQYIYKNGRFYSASGLVNLAEVSKKGRDLATTTINGDLVGCWMRSDGLACDYKGSMSVQGTTGIHSQATYERRDIHRIRVYLNYLGGKARVIAYDDAMAMFWMTELRL